MKNILSSLIVTTVIVVVSANTSQAQEIKLRHKVEMNTVEIDRMQVLHELSLQKEHSQNKYKSNSKRVKVNARPITIPLKKRIIKKD
jgi:hypothetical protein